MLKKQSVCRDRIKTDLLVRSRWVPIFVVVDTLAYRKCCGSCNSTDRLKKKMKNSMET